MKQLIILHGWSCFENNDTFCEAIKTWNYNPFEEKKRWRPWLAEKLKNEYEVAKLEMPNKDMASYKAWKIWFEKIFIYLNDEDLILVGHSLWVFFLCKYLSENWFPKKIKQLHLVSGLIDDQDLPPEEKYIWDFEFDITKLPEIQNYADTIFLYHSTDDTCVPYQQTVRIQELLPEAKLTTFSDRWHINQPEFPELLENILG